VSYVRPLRDGNLLVHDLSRRQVVILDRSLALKSFVVDTNASSAGGYISRLAGLLPYRGDSSLFVDPQAMTMSVIDDTGALVRVMAIPRPQDADRMIGGPFGTPGVDPSGHIVYRGLASPDRRNASTGAPEPGQAFRMPQVPDSAPLLRVDLITRRVDTLTFLKIPALTFQVDETDGRYVTSVRTNPMPIVDDWAVLPDGRVAVVRGGDYHVDWLLQSGRWLSTPKLPYAWERLTEEAKQRVIDSAMVEWQRQREAVSRIVEGSGGSSARTSQSESGARVSGIQRPRGPTYRSVESKELPDYRPAFRQGSVVVDRVGNLWVRTTSPSDAGPVYDVIDGRGVLVDRVQLWPGRTLSAIGDGVAYLGVMSDGHARLEVAKLR